METQKQRVKRLSDSVLSFNPDSLYSHVRLRELGSVLRKEDDYTAVKIYKNLNRRIAFSALTSAGTFTTGIFSMAYAMDLLVNKPSDLVGAGFATASVLLAYFSLKTREDSVKMRDNVKSVVAEARRQHEEERSYLKHLNK